MKNLLVVDDSFTVRKVIEMLLVPMGYKLTFAESGKKALELVKSDGFELAMIDLGLPDINGVSVSKEIKKVAPGLKVILMHSAKEEIDETRLMEGMVDERVTKPFDSQTLLSKIESVSMAVEPEPVLFEKKIVSEKPIIEESFKIDLDVGEEFSFEPSEKKQPEEIAEITEIDELAELELIEEPEEPKKEEVELEEEISLEDLLEEGEIKVEEEEFSAEPQKVSPQPEDTRKINIDELFSDLNEILAEKEEPVKIMEEDATWMPKDVKPVVEEVAKELKELDTLLEEEEVKLEEIEEADLWDFDLEEEKKEAVKEEKTVSEKAAVQEPELTGTDRASLERLIKEITYEVVEKIAWEVVPEIVDTIMKDKFGKK